MVPSIMLLLLAAPPGLEPGNPESESGVLPIRLKGNISTPLAFGSVENGFAFHNQ